MLKRSFYIIAAFVAILFVSCNKYDDAIAEIENRLDKIEGSTINNVNKQIEDITSSIKDLEHVDYILSDAIFKLGVELGELEDELLGTEIANINKLIEALKAKDTELDYKIAELKTYADSLNSSMKDWANGTFATLEQYSAMQTEMSAIKTLIETYKTDITLEYTKAIEEAVLECEIAMKKWVNELLAEGYYNIAEIDAKLSTLEQNLANADSELAKSIKQQQEALEQAKRDLTTAYQTAIKKAIDENNGVINKTIADAVKTAIDSVESKLSTIEDEVDNLKKEIKELKENFAKRIQSLTFLPQYSDGKVKMDCKTKSAEIDLLVSPRELAQFITANHLFAFVRLTDNPEARAVSNEYYVHVTKVNKSEGGVITLIINDTDSNIPTTFWDGSKDAILYVQINDGNNQVISQAIPVIAHSYVSGSYNIGGFEEGENYNGTVTE